MDDKEHLEFLYSELDIADARIKVLEKELVQERDKLAAAMAELSDEQIDDIAVKAICKHGSKKTKDALLHDHGPYGITRCNYDVTNIIRAVLRAAEERNETSSS